MEALRQSFSSGREICTRPAHNLCLVSVHPAIDAALLIGDMPFMARWTVIDAVECQVMRHPSSGNLWLAYTPRPSRDDANS